MNNKHSIPATGYWRRVTADAAVRLLAPSGRASALPPGHLLRAVLVPALALVLVAPPAVVVSGD